MSKTLARLHFERSIIDTTDYCFCCCYPTPLKLCNNCEKKVCNQCSSTCDQCKKNTCPCCSLYCRGCLNHICESHVIKICDICNIKQCNDCFSDSKICKKCDVIMASKKMTLACEKIGKNMIKNMIQRGCIFIFN
jgi:hypothetical protein